jgi:hypothetical protein
MRTLYCAAAIVAVLLDSVSGFAATVKKSNGEVVEGQVLGLVVQKGPVKDSRVPGDARYTVTYYTTNGSDVSVIDEKGLQYVPGAVIGVWVVTQSTPPDDLEALETAVGPAMFLRRLPKGGGLMASGRRGKEGPLTERLLGTFRMGDKRGSVLPYLEIQTAKGVVKVQASEIAAFK